MWSAEGTEQVRQEKAAEVAQKISQMHAKGMLSKTQEGYVKRLNSTLERIHSPFERPSKLLYQGQPHIVVGVSLGLKKLATIAVWDASTNQVLAYRSLKQLLSDDYALLMRQRWQQQQTAHLRHKAQKQFAQNHHGATELGQHVDRLIAKSIVSLAQAYRAGSIAVPKMKDIREAVQAEIAAKAEQKCPGCLEGQKAYAKQYRISVHHWSYGRLLENIGSAAAKVGIVIEEGQQPHQGTAQNRAREVAIAAYAMRK